MQLPLLNKRASSRCEYYLSEISGSLHLTTLNRPFMSASYFESATKIIAEAVSIGPVAVAVDI
jgi:hypothetical protein